MLGEIALGGGLLTVVFESLLVVTLLLLVDSVTIGSAAKAALTKNRLKTTYINTLIVLHLPTCTLSKYDMF